MPATCSNELPRPGRLLRRLLLRSAPLPRRSPLSYMSLEDGERDGVRDYHCLRTAALGEERITLALCLGVDHCDDAGRSVRALLPASAVDLNGTKLLLKSTCLGAGGLRRRRLP